MAGVMPIVHQVEERCDTYRLGKEHRLQVRENILMKWQEDWQRYDGWAKQFIENVAEWHKNGWVEVDHFLTQAITGHGCFGTYLKRMGKRDSDRCVYCQEQDTPAHTLFECGRWREFRDVAEARCGTKVTLDNVGALMGEDQEKSIAVAEMLRVIMKTKFQEELAQRLIHRMHT